jgi:hypothetical protein
MAPNYATVPELRRTISTEILAAAGVPRTGLLQTLLRPLVWPPAHRFSHLMAKLDRRLAEAGLTEAVRWLLPRFVEDVRVHGSEHVPSTGPLIVASNHPGSTDVLAIVSALGRDDLKIYVSDVAFLRSLYASSRHLIFTPAEPHRRMAAIREGIRHLGNGGALLILATGLVEPDPAVMPGAEEALQKWSASLPLFLHCVPEAKLLVTVVSGVLAPAALRHPLTRLQANLRLKQMLAEFVQVSQQMLFRRRFGLRPAVRFAQPLVASDLGSGHDAQAALTVITARARGLLAAVESDRRRDASPQNT